ncbi:hypothetical protein M0802_004129 [Mischocyttarus mexicanus]|nr:hypothetical protein M0802_004129 [Mischocyttarus mexicanus]
MHYLGAVVTDVAVGAGTGTRVLVVLEVHVFVIEEQKRSDNECSEGNGNSRRTVYIRVYVRYGEAVLATKQCHTVPCSSCSGSSSSSSSTDDGDSGGSSSINPPMGLVYAVVPELLYQDGTSPTSSLLRPELCSTIIPIYPCGGRYYHIIPRNPVARDLTVTLTFLEGR